MLVSGSHLFVALSAYELAEMQEVMARAAAQGLVATGLIALAGGLATSFWLLRRIDAIGLAARQIMSGDLGRRIARSGSGDEFERLAAGLNEMLDRIQHLMRGLQQVSSDIAHDLRTPLTRLRQRLELAAAAPAPSPTTRPRSMLRSVTARRSPRRFPAGQPERLADRAGRSLRARAGGGGPDAADADRTRASLARRSPVAAQLFANLIENALRHCPAGPQVCLEAHGNLGGVRVVISDDGPGVLKEFQHELLRPFSRLDRSRTTPGSGLGLSLALAIAVLHDARLTLEDAEPGLRCVAAFSTIVR